MSFAPELERSTRQPRQRAARATNIKASYEAASYSTRTRGWSAPTITPNGSVGNLTTLRDRSRAAVRNDGYAKGALDKIVSNIVGTGIKPLSQATDPDLRQKIQALWLRWTDESDADGLLDWYGQQVQSVRAWLEGGSVFGRLRSRLVSDGLSVPMQVQLIEPELCPHNYTTTLAGGNRVRFGIEFDAIGRRVAYWFYASRPGDLVEFDRSDLRRVPAEVITHLFDPLRPGQLHGIPYLAQALVKLYELDAFDDATLVRQKLANLFVAFLTRQPPAGDEVTTDTFTGQTQQTDDSGNPLLPLEPGLFQELDPGEDVKFSTPPGVADFYADFMRQQLSSVSASTGTPYEVLTGDLRGVSDRALRVILLEFRRRIQILQHQIVVFQFCRPVWRAWFDAAVLSGALPINAAAYARDPEQFRAVKWMPQGWPYLHPVQDVEADKAAVRAGFASRSSVVSERGEDSEAIDAENAGDNSRADELGLRYDSDGRSAPSAAAPPAAAASDPAADEPAQPAR
jgi:lambda family phage portal protein